MTAQAGWYPDPSGNVEKLRFWDGNQWTNDFMDVASTVQPIEQSAQAQGIVPQSVQDPITPAQAVQEPLVQPLYGVQQANGGTNGGATNQGYQSPNYGAPASYANPSAYGSVYEVDSMDSTLRLVAFVFYMLTLASVVMMALFTFGFSLICLAWVIPMSVMCWKIYKGQRANTIAFGVCTLLFVNMIAGILLLVSKKEN